MFTAPNNVARWVLYLSGHCQDNCGFRQTHEGCQVFSADPPSRSDQIDIRTTPAVKQMLQAAVAAGRKSVTSFVLDLTLAEVAEWHSQQRLFSLGDPQWDAFITALDAPARPKPRLWALPHQPGVLN